jgi:hypothetical protein
MENISLKKAQDLQNATAACITQNMHIESAVKSLKEITHRPLPTIDVTYKLNEKNQVLGISDDDRKKISEFYEWLESKKMPMRELFASIVKSEN